MRNTRRSFLTRTAGAFGFAAGTAALRFAPEAVASPLQLRRLLAVSATDENYWTLVAKQYPLRAGKVPMNAANLCPSPRIVSERVADLTRDEDSDISSANRSKFGTLEEESRAKVASHLGVLPDEVALMRNTSEANTVINNGIDLKPGDEVVLWDQNHQSNGAAWELRAMRHGFTVKKVGVPNDVKSAEEIVKLFEAAVTPRTKAISITYISNTSGIRLPAKAICSMARSRGIHAHVDGAQAWGYLNLDLKDLGCDSFASSAHKWFMGPKEVGVLYVRSERIPAIWPGVVSAGWNMNAINGKSASAKFEQLGQRDDAALAAVGTMVDFHQMIGAASVEARTTALATALKEGLAKLNAVKIVTPMDPALSGGVVIASVPAFERARMSALVRDLYDKYGIAGAGTGGLRLSPHTYNTMADIELAIKAVKELTA